jgi:DNA-binding Lrp family transcriptional regulator
MHAIATPPSCCAGLRQTLIQGWQQDFPLHPSPFRQMAARSGATPRELLSTCRELTRSGALQPIRARWGATLQRQRWRLAFDAAPGLAAALAALPGCFHIEHAEPGDDLPTLWAEIEALDEAALHRQLARLPLAPRARLRLPLAATLLGCDDPRLAACVEQGLQLCSKPFAECARQLGCSEHHVLSSLSAWRRSGQLEGLVLKPPPTPVPQPGLLALWQRLDPPDELLARLREQRSIARVIHGPGTDAWPWRLSVVLRATPQLGAEPWREQLAAAGLAAMPDSSLRLRIEQPRDQALLFSADRRPDA